MSFNAGLPSFRVAGHGMAGTYYGGFYGWPTRRPNQWPLVADSYSPYYGTPQTQYGSCDFAGGRLRRNNCNFQQGGYRPQGVRGGGCRCVSADGKDWGCFGRRGGVCK